MIIEIGLVALAGAAALALYKKYFATTTSTVASVTGGTSAFAKVAEADGKIIALKAVADVKKAEALAVHDSLDEIHKILG